MGRLADLNVDIHAFLQQFTPWSFKSPLTPDDYRWASIQLRQRLTTSVQSGQVNFRAPANFNMLIFAITGHLAFNDPDGETLSITGIGNPSVVDRILLKAMNVRIAFQNSDRSGGAKIFENQDKPLSNLLPHVGGKPLEFFPPYIVKDAENLQMDVSILDTGTSIIGGSTDVGLDLTALLVRVSH